MLRMVPLPCKSRGGATKLQLPFEPALQLRLRRGADLGGGGGAVLEQDHRRDAAYAIAGRCVRIVVDVELHDRHLLVKLAADLLERGGNHPTGAAPFSPEVDEHGLFGADHIVLEAVVGNVLGAHSCSPRGSENM